MDSETRYELSLKLGGLVNFEVEYFPGMCFFQILGGGGEGGEGYPLGGPVCPMGDLVLFDP